MDARPYLTALLVLDAGAAAGWAREHGLEGASSKSIAENPHLLAEVDHAVGCVNAEVSDVEQIRGFTLFHDDWTVETGELTPTLKIRRSAICEKYADDIEQMYREPRKATTESSTR